MPTTKYRIFEPFHPNIVTLIFSASHFKKIRAQPRAQPTVPFNCPSPPQLIAFSRSDHLAQGTSKSPGGHHSRVSCPSHAQIPARKPYVLPHPASNTCASIFGQHFKRAPPACHACPELAEGSLPAVSEIEPVEGRFDDRAVTCGNFPPPKPRISRKIRTFLLHYFPLHFCKTSSSRANSFLHPLTAWSLPADGGPTSASLLYDQACAQ
jgi:hypothetical protein